MFAVLVLYYIF